mgnify:CR=1 FL=1
MQRSTIVLLVALLLSACGPSLIVRHLDPDNERAHIWVDGMKVGEVSYGESLDLSLDSGLYRLKATRPGETTNPWLEGGGEWNFFMANDVYLSLLPDLPKPGVDAP